MIHIGSKTTSTNARYALVIPILACMLATLACSQSATMAKQNNMPVRNDSLSGTPVQRPDIMPVFPGGDESLLAYINNHLNYPGIAKERKIQGRVSLRFVIDTDGWAKKFEVVKSVHPDLDEAAIQALKGMPRWKPGQKNGVNVPVYYTMPILFKIPTQ